MATENGFADQLGDLLNTPTPPLPNAFVITLGVLALTAGVTATWFRYLTVVNTLFHEAGHAVAAVLTGGGVYTIRIHTHESGVTHAWFSTRASDFATTFAGYATPPLAGLGIARLVHDQKAATALLLLTIVSAGVLLVSRDLLTVVVTSVTAAVSASGVWWGSLWVHGVLATVVAWMFLVCEATHLVKELVARYVLGRHMESDADWLGGPSLLWYVAWLALNGWCLWVAVPLLLR